MSKTSIAWTNRTWNPIPNFDGYYASKDGCIKGKRGIMHPMKTKDGHLYVYLYDGYGNQKKMFVHRLILMSFDRMPNQNEEARHLNDIPSDNRITNLAWGSRVENVVDKRRNGRIPVGEKCGTHKLTEHQVTEICEKYKDGLSSRDIAFEYGVAHTTILKIARCQRWKHIVKKPIVAYHPSVRKDCITNKI